MVPPYFYSSKISSVTKTTNVYGFQKHRRTTIREPPLINLPESDTEREENPVKMNNLTSCFTRRKAKKHESKPGVTYANIDMAASLKERVVFAWYLRNLEQKQFVKLELVSVTFCEATDI